MGRRLVPLTAQISIVLMVSSVHVLMSASLPAQTMHEDPTRLYPFILVTSSYFGRLQDSALPGSHVPFDSSLPRAHPQVDPDFLRLSLVPNHPYSQTLTAATQSPAQTTEGATVLPTSAPGLTLEVSEVEEEGGGEGPREGTSGRRMFTVDPNNFVVVNDSRQLSSVSGVQFWVVAVRHMTDTSSEIVSNPVAFIVQIDHDDTREDTSSIYVGIVVLVICLFAFLIPLTVRTKRRMREGKPICACGSSQKKLESRMRSENGNGNDSAAAIPTITRGRQMGDPRASLAVSLFGSEPSGESSAHRGETFQHKVLRSESEHHFQPRWLDPHYKDVYEHPKYKVTKVPQPVELEVLHEGGEGASAAASTATATSRPGGVVERL